MSWDLLVKGGRVVDGTGAPAVETDVAVRGQRIARVGRADGPAERVIDAEGLIVTPGFIDVHTHYDAQLAWEPTASPSSWHGVTTVICGNCGFTLAPARPEDCEWLTRMLSRVEGMSPEALQEGLHWQGGSFGDYWRRYEGRLGVNAAAYVGHSAVRRFAMGDDASVRTARPDEIETMRGLVREAMREGALGFSSSQLDMHVAHDGPEVPSNFAAPEELLALVSVLAEFEHASLEFIPRSFAEGYSPADRELILEMARRSGCAIELNTLAPMPANPLSWKQSMEFAHLAHDEGLRVHPMFRSNRGGGVFFALGSTFLFDEHPSFRETLTLPPPERERRLRDPAVRERLRRDLAGARSFRPNWEVCVVEAVRDAEHQHWIGRTVAALAAERGVEPFDCFLDLSLEEDLVTTFGQSRPPSPEARPIQAESPTSQETMILDPLLTAGSSDAGAHLLSMVGADYTTRLVGEWVPETLTLEQAVARITGIPAAGHALLDRGVIREGAYADLTIFDPERLGVGSTRLVQDFPAASSRLVVDAEGYTATVVNGQIFYQDGKHTGALAGHWLRGG